MLLAEITRQTGISRAQIVRDAVRIAIEDCFYYNFDEERQLAITLAQYDEDSYTTIAETSEAKREPRSG